MTEDDGPQEILDLHRRAKKIVLIESTNPRWQDLAEKWGAEMAFAGQSITGR
jgi:hypothetical protein